MAAARCRHSFAEVGKECAAAKADERLADLAGRVEKTNGELQAATLWLMNNGLANPENAGAGAYDYMHLTGIVALGLMWLRMARASLAALDGGAEDKAFYEAKLITARYFGERYTPEAGALRRRMETGAEAVMALPVEAFARG
jgi:hypothetical protein